MARTGLSPIIVSLLACFGAVAIGLTTYTLPIEGAASDPELVALLRAALHDSTTSLPPLTSLLQVQAVPADTGAIAHAAESATTDLTRWITAAAAADPAALRAWLGRWVWATAVTERDTFRLTLRQLTFHAGCPLISRLDAVSARPTDLPLQLIRVTGTCPAPEN